MAKRPELKSYLLDWLNNNQGFHKKVDLYSIGDEIEHSPESTGRALRLLEEDKKIKVDYYNGVYAKNLAQYSSLDTPVPQKRKMQIIIKDGVPTATYE